MAEGKKLRLSQVPQADADYGVINRFAHRIDGYGLAGSFERCAEIARNPNMDSVEELHIALFYHYRAARHTGEPETEGDIAYVRGLVTHMRQLLS
jgi:hypothetical protein